MYLLHTLRLTCILFLCFITLINPLQASDLGSSDEENDNVYIPGNRWDEKIQESADALGFLDVSQLINDGDYRQEIEGHFYNYLNLYKKLDFSTVPDKKVEMAINLRSYEAKLSPYYNRKQFKPEDLWDSNEELEYIEIKTMKDIDIAVSKGAHEPSSDIIELIKSGGSTGFPLKNYLPSKFFRLPSNYAGQRFLVGGERLNLGQQQENYTLNYDRRFYPDILGDARSSASYVCIPDNKFSLVEFNLIDNRILMSIPILEECKRILRNGGTFTFRTQRDSTDAYKAINSEIQIGFDNLRGLFSDVKIAFETDKDWESPTQNKYWLFTAKKA